MTAIEVRLATAADLQSVVDITNHYIRNSSCIMKERDETVEERMAWWEGNADRYPILVAARGGEVVGWASLTPHSERTAYRFTVHDSVYVRQDLRGQGIGTALLGSLLLHAKGLGYHSVIAVIGAAQPMSLQLHHRFGFTDVAYLRQVGFKFDEWVDVVQLQLML